LHIVEGADHGFGGYHHYEKKELPPHFEEVVKKSISFLKEK
jgi:hypothetical protein